MFPPLCLWYVPQAPGPFLWLWQILESPQLFHIPPGSPHCGAAATGPSSGLWCYIPSYCPSSRRGGSAGFLGGQSPGLSVVTLVFSVPPSLVQPVPYMKFPLCERPRVVSGVLNHLCELKIYACSGRRTGYESRCPERRPGSAPNPT